MADLVFNNGTDTLTFPEAVGADYRNAGTKYHEKAPVPGGAEYAYQDIESSLDGVDTKTHGFRNRVIGPFVLVWIGATAQAAVSAYLADRAKLENVEITVTHPTAGSIPGCRLPAQGGIVPETGFAQDTGAGTWMFVATVVLEQKKT